MPRPPNKRWIGRGLPSNLFHPAGWHRGRREEVALSLDQLEALRLADVVGLYHEEAAKRMGVSRATFGRILAEARRTLAGAVIEGKAIRTGGGAVDERPSPPSSCPVHGGRGRRGRRCGCGHGRDAEQHGRQEKQGG